MYDSDFSPNRRILVVDDNHTIHHDFRKILVSECGSADLNHAADAFFGQTSVFKARMTDEIDDAFQGAEALEMVSASVREGRPYDMAFVDMQMPPGWNGLQTIEQLWQVDPCLQVVICTAHSDYSWQEILQRLGRNDRWLVLKKPFEAIEAEQITAALTEKRRLLQQRERQTHCLEKRVSLQTSDIRRAHEETVHRLVAASMFRDKETGEHIWRVGLMSAVVAQALGWNTTDTECIRMAAMMHDVGKIGVPDAILQKAAPLNSAERKVIETHTVIGGDLLSNSDSPMLQMAHRIALYHHERWDGTGYPTGLSGLEIPEAARIVAVVDVFDALTHDRVYRPALSIATALEFIQHGSGSHFDPHIVSLFLGSLTEIEAVQWKHPDCSVSGTLAAMMETAEMC